MERRLVSRKEDRGFSDSGSGSGLGFVGLWLATFVGIWLLMSASVSTIRPDSSTVTNRVFFGWDGSALPTADPEEAPSLARSSFWRSAMMSYRVRSRVLSDGVSRGGWDRGISGSGEVETVESAARRCFRLREGAMIREVALRGSWRCG